MAKSKIITASVCFTIGIVIGSWICYKYLGMDNLFLVSSWEKAAKVNQLGWFGVFLGIFAFCSFTGVAYLLYKALSEDKT